ncbi:hypothetical protein JX265_003637 [Neoarthrinium moseri]|uniref:1-alkyl-2-acetylglycerophosphocholine esterase n=1 Tax=Neoarthrinium moseri TaxID=1658444 RepID=A0A9P9WSM5_9PEZI|nr:hypothetical protein JX266_001180 [Neoarthrinium moseri]KAI1877629.1 hypothetical protein JX265_003637 [Neoarthrinium moseri]
MRAVHTQIAFWAMLNRATLASEVGGSAIPPPTGPYAVGVRKFEIDYVNTEDPVAPGNVSTSFLATAFYPTSARYGNIAEPYLDPAVAALWETTYNLSAGDLASLTSTLARNAPALDNISFPTLVFGPGGAGPPTEVFTIILSDLASHGYTVFGLDHPYEQPFVRFPNGTGIYGLPVISVGFTPEFVTALHNIRVNETIAFINNIPDISRELGSSVNTTHIGTFGTSLGGSAALGALLKDPRIKSGINVDGTFWGDLRANDSSVDAARPVFLFGNTGHFGSNRSDITWATFPAAQTGWWRQLNVNGSFHHDFSDRTFWKEVFGIQQSTLGPINGYRMINITRTFIRAFFDYTLLGKPQSIFDGSSDAWPEIIYSGGGNGSESTNV